MKRKNLVNRNYKDGIFRSLFNDEEVLLELYNALSGNEYPEGTKVEIVTLDNIVFNGIKNDLAFTIEDRFVVLTEQQSTMSPNLPLRLFCYLARVYEDMTNSAGIYTSTLVKLPTPELYVFYNGEKDFPLEQTMKLSDAFTEKSDIIAVEAIVKIINVNYDKGAELLERCKPLQEYSLFIHRVRQLYAENNDLDMAVADCIREFIEKDVLSEYLKKHKGDIMSVLEVILTEEEKEEIHKLNARLEIAKGLKDDGVPIEIIAKNTKLSIEQIEEL